MFSLSIGKGMNRAVLQSLIVGFTVADLASPVGPADIPKEYQEALARLGREGDFKAHVLKVNIPRNDLEVTVKGISTPTPFGFGGWVAMTKGDGGAEVLMGDLVLLEDEVNPVMSALLGNDLEITALHNHFFWEEPRLFYMHIFGRGQASDLAGRLRPALDLISSLKSQTPANRPKPAAKATLDTAKLAAIVGHAGDQTGRVYKITLGRDDLAMRHHGATINARMGLNTWAAFLGSDAEAVIAGDVAMREEELTPVLQALRRHGLEVVAIHHHMTGARPMVIFLHYWGTGPVEKLAKGFRAALDQLGKE